MTPYARFRSWLRASLRRSGMEREMDNELRFHIERYTEDLVRDSVQSRAAVELIPAGDRMDFPDLVQALLAAGRPVRTHTHSDYCVAVACHCKPLPGFHYMVGAFGGDDVPCVPYATFGSETLARAVQHEADHLNGILFIDRMDKKTKDELRPDLEQLQAETKAALKK